MIKDKNKLSYRKLEIDLTGPDGNAFCLMGYAKKFAKDMGKKADPIINEMMSGDYENLISVFDREFGDFVDLIR